MLSDQRSLLRNKLWSLLLASTGHRAEQELFTQKAERVRNQVAFKKYCECFQAGLPCSQICKCLYCKNTKGSKSRTPYQDDKDAVIISGGNLPKIVPEKKVSKFLFGSGKFLWSLKVTRFWGIEERQQDASMEEEKGHARHEATSRAEASIQSLIRGEMPSLKVAYMPITMDDLQPKAGGEANVAMQESPEKGQSGFYDILGLSKRSPEGQ
jgi:hypothetical protein